MPETPLSVALRRAAIVAVTRVTRRRPGFRPATSVAFRLSEPLQRAADPVLVEARLPTGSAIELDLRDEAQRHINIWGKLADLESTIRRFARPGWTVLDVGANAGYVSVICADLGGRDSRIHAFEPQPDLAAMLRRTVDRNDSPIVVVEAACGGADGDIELYRSTDPNRAALATALPRRYTVTTDAIRVKLLRLDTYCAHSRLTPDFVKIDVEGFEAEVVAGAVETLDRTSAPVLCEVSFGLPSTDRVFDLFNSLGYRSALSDGKPFRFPDDERKGCPNADILFQRPRKRHE